ncbi:ALBINO3-like protein 1, chloroplastic [Miscanthus floridulus]|uniref:ALBINO3-like protein 1, chloroplastic n=1 Tax=Miscanthus floridulus TaxID=154761 RepID=UPI0034598382
MAAPSHLHLHLHLHLPGCPQTLALPLPSPRGFSARPGLRSRSRLRPVAALGPADAGDLLGRVEAFLYTVADAAVSAEPVVTAADGGTKEATAGDWLSGITNSMETVLKVLKDGLSALHVPYSYGFAIILLTVLVKAATFPLTKKQVESALAMRSLQPQVKAIQERYAGDQERIQLETARLYKLSGVNPLAGCLPTLVTIPVWIGLYRALSNVANEGLLTEGFFWIPSLAGPTTIAARQNGQGISWLFPFTDGHPPLGWSDTLAYLVLPVLLVISQYISTQVMQPPQSNDPNQQGAQAVTKFLPLLVGYFALSVPSGLGLYWLTNNILSTAQQVWLQKLGGAKNPVEEYIDKLSREESTTVQKNESTVQSEPLPKLSKPQPSQDPKPSGPQRGERFRKLKEEESRRKEVLGQAKQSEQSSSESSFLDETQNSDASSGDKKDQQESHENGPIVTNSNGGVNHSRNEKAQHLSSEKEAADDHSSVSKPVSPDAHKLTDRENGNDAV